MQDTLCREDIHLSAFVSCKLVCMKVEVDGERSMGKQELQVQIEEPCIDRLPSTVPGSGEPACKMPSKRFKRICVFCGSSRGKKDIFSNVAFSLGRELVSD